MLCVPASCESVHHVHTTMMMTCHSQRHLNVCAAVFHNVQSTLHSGLLYYVVPGIHCS